MVDDCGGLIADMPNADDSDSTKVSGEKNAAAAPLDDEDGADGAGDGAAEPPGVPTDGEDDDDDGNAGRT